MMPFEIIVSDPVSVLEQMEPTKENVEDLGQYLVLNFPMTVIHLFQNATANLYKNPYYKAEVVAVIL